MLRLSSTFLCIDENRARLADLKGKGARPRLSDLHFQQSATGSGKTSQILPSEPASILDFPVFTLESKEGHWGLTLFPFPQDLPALRNLPTLDASQVGTSALLELPNPQLN